MMMTDRFALAGTYTRGTASDGIYALGNSGEVKCVADGLDNPSFLVKHPFLDVIYAVSEVRDYRGSGGAVLALDAGGAERMRVIGQVASLGDDPCHLAISSTGRFLLVSNYSSGTFATLPVSSTGEPGDFISLVQHSGSGVDPVRQTGPHVHSVQLGPGERHVYVVDLGIDQIVRYPISPGGQVNAPGRKTTRLKPGAGPRHLCFDAGSGSGSGSGFCYVINELDNTVTSFAVDEEVGLVEMATFSTLPPDCEEANYTAEICLSPDGRFLYGSNRGHDSLVVFRVLGEGQLESVQHISTGGRHPRHFALTRDGSQLLVANRDSSNIVVFYRHPETGILTRSGMEYAVPAPVCVRIL